MSSRRKPDSDHGPSADPDRPPTAEYLAVEADLEHETDQFGTYATVLMEREIADREAAEQALDIVDHWLIQIEKVEENPHLSPLSDVELFNIRASMVPPVAVVRQWMGQSDNFERLMAFRDALDQERFDLPERT